ncbi:hypothetical protein KB236_11400 [Levilactobacillus brevis]|uniref:DUF5776 domain-containing protein n=1 Tax=Levilactobacillus hammesii TaxID=267633 RepID=A0A921EYN0_9LACO|nr:hypothetical protein KB236_11400 [Levilactobacillus brevis]HJE86582.1 DUF5776 domain-containing protein [Levilactobacillus hammesii]
MKQHNQFKQLMFAGILGAVMTVGGVMTTQLTGQAATEPTTGQTTTEPHADQDVVTFGDSNLEEIVAKGLGVTGPVTYGDIRHYSGKQLDLDYTLLPKYDAKENTPILLSSLEGIQSLQELPAGIGVKVQLALESDVSLALFEGLPVSGSFSVLQDNMHGRRDFTDLNRINLIADPTHSPMRKLTIGGATRYKNQGGLTNYDVKELKPLFAKFTSLRTATAEDPTNIALPDQNVTDFSFFKQFSPVYVVAYGEFTVFSQPTYIDPATFTQETQLRVPAPFKGLDGEPVQTSTSVWSAASQKFTEFPTEGTDALVKGIDAESPWLILGHWQGNKNFNYLAPIQYKDGNKLSVDGYQYYKLVWEKAPDESSNSSSNTNTNTPGTGTTTSPDADSSSAVTSSSENAKEGDQAVAVKGSVVYAVKPIYLYQRPTFKQSQRQARYVKQPRINRPMFVVTGYAQSVNGHARYLVKDVNHHSKTAGKTGYITANAKYTVPVYYQKKAAKMTVINPAGVNAYRQVGLKKRVTHYRQGTTLKVTGLKHYRLTTRFKLSNGTYVTANRKLVTTQKTTTPAYIRTKTTVNRYRTVNLTGKRGSYAAKKRVKVLGWAYSQPTNFDHFGTLRYRVAGGYVTANAKYVQAIR